MPIVQSFAGQILDDVYLIEVATPPTIQGVQVGIIGMVGSFSQGIPTGIYSISDYATAVRLLGKSAAGLTGAIAIQNIIRQGAGNIHVVPAFGAGALAASVDIYDAQATPGKLGKLTAANPHPQTGVMTSLLGTGPNSWVLKVSAGIAEGTFNIVIQTPAATESFVGVSPANWIQAINSGVSGINNGNPSNLVIASAATTPSAQVAAPGAYQFSGGSMGTVNDSAYIGQINEDGSRTGLALLETITVNLIFVAETGSSTINTQLATFANNHNCMAVVCAPAGSTVAATEAAKSTISQDNVVFLDGWVTCYDQDQGMNITCAPTAFVVGMVAVLAPQKSWGNKQLSGIQAINQPRSNSELAELQQYGILALANPIPRGKAFGTRSGISSDGVTDAYVRRMRYFLELSVMNAMGWAVDELQSSSKDDKLRGDIKKTVDTFFRGLAYPADPALKVIDSFDTVCDLTNNPPDQIAAGKLYLTIKVRLLAAAKQIVISAEISPGTITTSSKAA